MNELRLDLFPAPAVPSQSSTLFPVPSSIPRTESHNYLFDYSETNPDTDYQLITDIILKEPDTVYISIQGFHLFTYEVNEDTLTFPIDYIAFAACKYSEIMFTTTKYHPKITVILKRVDPEIQKALNGDGRNDARVYDRKNGLLYMSNMCGPHESMKEHIGTHIIGELFSVNAPNSRGMDMELALLGPK